jgi:anti-sigma B factor antagonist
LEDPVLDQPAVYLSHYCSMRADRDFDTIILRLSGEFDLACEERFCEELEHALLDPAQRLVLDLRGLDFMDSTGLRVLIQIDARARSDEFEFVVLCGEGHVRYVLRESGLDGVLPVVDGAGAVPASDSPV